MVLSASGCSLTRQLNQTAATPPRLMNLALPVSVFVVYDPMAIMMNHECLPSYVTSGLFKKNSFLRSFALLSRSFQNTILAKIFPTCSLVIYVRLQGTKQRNQIQ
jgi:hypothetical protein